MTKRQKWTGSIVAVAAVGVGVIGVSMISRHANDARVEGRARASVVADAEIVKALQDANVPVDGLVVGNVGGVVIVRGNGDKAAVQQVLQRLNLPRVANLVVPGYKPDDESIRREAERKLASTRALDGCVLRVSCERGVLRVSGTVQSELQIDVARSTLRGVAGAQEVKVELSPAPQS